MATRILIRRGTYAEWVSANPILKYGEISYDLTNNKIKVGDGTNPWLALDYLACDGMEPQLVGGTQVMPFSVALDCSKVGNTASVMIPEGYVGILSAGTSYGYINWSGCFNGYQKGTGEKFDITNPKINIETYSCAWGGSADYESGVLYVRKNTVPGMTISGFGCGTISVSDYGSLYGGYPITFNVTTAFGCTEYMKDFYYPYAFLWGYVYLIKNESLANANEVKLV